MGRQAVQPSGALARVLRERRLELGWTLRDVESRTKSLGRPIPFTTLAKIEQGRVDPGLRRLHVLLRLYDLPAGLSEDVLDLEEFAGPVPDDADPATSYARAIDVWRSGDLRLGFAHLASIRALTPTDAAGRLEHQKALISVAIAIGALGRFRLSKQIVDEILLDRPEREILVSALVQAAICWHWLGSCEVALGFLARAEANVLPSDLRQRAWIAHERGSTMASMGRTGDAESFVAEAIRLYRAAGDAYGESIALGVRVRLGFEAGDPAGALAAAREAREFAERHEFGRLLVLRGLDEGRALVDLGEREAGLAALHDALAKSIQSQDHVAQFYAHHRLWKAYVRLGDAGRSEVELGAARYFVRFLDAAVPEALEIRGLTAGGLVAHP